MVHRNADLPDMAEIGALPKHAIVGRLGQDTELRDAVATLREHGIGDDRVHVLEGPEGEAFIERGGNAISRAMASEERQRYLDELRGGATLVGLFGVADPDQDATIAAARDAGIEVLRHFGKWTYA